MPGGGWRRSLRRRFNVFRAVKVTHDPEFALFTPSDHPCGGPTACPLMVTCAGRPPPTPTATHLVCWDLISFSLTSKPSSGIASSRVSARDPHDSSQSLLWAFPMWHFPQWMQRPPSPTQQLTEARDGSCHLPSPRVRLARGGHLAVILSD